MAPNGHTASGKRGARKSRDAQSASWLDKHGFEEYEAWKEANPDTRILYDDWKQSNQSNSGLSLYYTTLHIFEESDSSVGQSSSWRQNSVFANNTRTKMGNQPRLNLNPQNNGVRLVVRGNRRP